MRKFLGPEGEEVEALRITDRTFDYPNPNAVLPASGTTGDTAVPGSWTIIPLKRTSVTGLFATRTARCRSPPQTILRDTTGLRGFGWHEARKITPLPAEPAELRVEGLYGISHFGKRPSCI